MKHTCWSFFLWCVPALCCICSSNIKTVSEDYILELAYPPDPEEHPHGLDSRAPEVRRIFADALMKSADNARCCIRKVQVVLHDDASTDLDKLPKIAVRALLILFMRKERQMALKWTDWWYKTHPHIMYDERSAYDKFLAYVLLRVYAKIPDTPEILEFERELIKQYQKGDPVPAKRVGDAEPGDPSKDCAPSFDLDV